MANPASPSDPISETQVPVRSKKRKKLTNEEKQAWFDWAIPFAPQSNRWHESEEARTALKRYLLSQMVLVAEEDLKETMLRAQKNGVDLNLVAEQAILLDKQDLFFAIARHLKVNWNGWTRAQIEERSNLNEVLANMPTQFKTDLEERFRYPTMVHFLIHHQPEWVPQLLKKGWEAASPFEIKNAAFVDYPICRAWMEKQTDLVQTLWDLPEVQSSQDNKDAFFNLLAVSSFNNAAADSDRITWMSELLHQGADPNRADQIKPGHPPAGMILLHQVLRFPWGEAFAQETNFLKKIHAESWPASTWPKAMIQIASHALGDGVLSNQFARQCLSFALKAPSSTPNAVEEQVLDEIIQGRSAIGSWFLDEGYRLSFDTSARLFAHLWRERGAKGIDLYVPTKNLNPGVSILKASWSLLGSFMSEEEEQKWTQLSEALKALTPEFKTSSYKITREGCQIWLDQVLLKVQEFCTVDFENDSSPSKRRL